jgi:hypothetical protein
MGPLLAAAAAAAARTRACRGAVSPASSSVTLLTCAPSTRDPPKTPHHPCRKHRRAPSAGEATDPRGGIVRLSPTPRHLGQEILEGSGTCHAHRVARRALQLRCTVMALRDDRGQLLGSRSFGTTGPFSLGAVLAEMGCPCGKGRQTAAHVMWECELGGVVFRRRTLLAPACTALGKALDRCEPVSRDHAISTIVRRALEHGRRPAAYSTFTGATEPTSARMGEVESKM